jgi:hypothetical protein
MICDLPAPMSPRIIAPCASSLRFILNGQVGNALRVTTRFNFSTAFSGFVDLTIRPSPSASLTSFAYSSGSTSLLPRSLFSFS